MTKASLILLDSVAIAISLAISFKIAWDKDFLDPAYTQSFIKALAIFLIAKCIILSRMGLYRAILRYASFLFAITIIKAVTFATVVSYTLFLIIFNKAPIELLLVDWVLNLTFIGFIRFFPRYYDERNHPNSESEKKVLIYGAGDVGDALARSILRDKLRTYKVIGFIDDNPHKQSRKVHNIPVLGGIENLETFVKKFKIEELIVAISHYQADHLRELVKKCRSMRVFCRLAPTIPYMISDDLNLKNIDVSDLLKRNPEDLDEKQIIKFIQGKKILVTGAAGSIGSEIVRQCLKFNAERVLLLDNSEFGLYKMEEELRETAKNNLNKLQFILLNLSNNEAINQLVQNEKPDLIVHAAAFKHVPLVEANPYEAVINNVVGTLNIANAAHKHNVEKFVLISTDKAVRPTNIMGATKRICELYIQNLNFHSSTEYVAVRFGNVLGSSGSVIPKFLKQIKSGGPITVTHPDVVRYFMLIEEAVELTLQAASIGHGSEIFILDMGKPVNIKEVAEDLIFLAGKEPYKDIDIQFIGLRPGEKLYEELLIDHSEKKTQYSNITIAKNMVINWSVLDKEINSLIEKAKNQNRLEVLLAIRRLVPEFNHAELTGINIPDENSGKIIPISRN